MGAAPLISVLLPVFNGADTIGRAIASIQRQTETDWELFVADDGSTDGSARTARRAAGNDRRIHVLHWPHRGLTATLQEAGTLARGTYIARMDADDVSMPSRLRTQRAWFDAHPEGGLCGTQVRVTGARVREGRRRYEGWLNGLAGHEQIERELFVECPIAHPAFMMRRDAFEAAGGYRDFDGPEDYDLVFRFWHGGYLLGNVGGPLLDWYESPGRLSMNSPRYREGAFRALKRHWLQKAGVGAGRPWYQWGAGEVGKRWLREWPPGTMAAVVDIRPGKIGQCIHGHPVIRPEDLPRPGHCFFLVAVGTPGARAKIRTWCTEHGYTECDDYRFIA